MITRSPIIASFTFHTTRRLAYVCILVSLLSTPACTSGVSRIRGGTGNYYSRGNLTTLQLESPDGQITVAVRFPKEVDNSFEPGFGHSGNGDDVTNWDEVYKVRFQGNEEHSVLTVAWGYSSRTRKLRFANGEYEFPLGRIAVLGFDQKMVE
jgi:hypothetical protein